MYNIVQEIMLDLLKAIHFNLFKSGISDLSTSAKAVRESVFIKNFMISHYYENLHVGRAFNNKKTILIWKSSIDRFTSIWVACYVTDAGFFFSSVAPYDKEENYLVHRSFNDAEMIQVQNDIEGIKALLSTYSIDAKTYFK